MELPLKITYRDFQASEAITVKVRDYAAKLETFHNRITGCRVVIEALNRRHRKGNLYNVRIDVTVPGKELVVGREAAASHAHEDLYVAVRDAFHAAQRQLQEYARKQRGEVKTHVATM